MKSKEKIPMYNFTSDDESSIPFKLIPLETRTGYDTTKAHRHNYYEIFFFTKGGGTHFIDLEALPIQSRSIHFISPGQVHQVRRELDSYGYVLLFSRDFYYLNLKNTDVLFEMPFLNNFVEKPVLNLNREEFTFFTDILDQMRTTSPGMNVYEQEMLRSYLNIILLQSRKLFEAYFSGYQNGNTENSIIYKKFRILLEKNFFELKKPADYASLLSVSEKNLNGVCKEVTGKTVSDVIRQRIVLEAKRNLAHAELTTKEIAYLLNFEDPSYFIKFFKKFTGITPGEFRKKQKKMEVV